MRCSRMCGVEVKIMNYSVRRRVPHSIQGDERCYCTQQRSLSLLLNCTEDPNTMSLTEANLRAHDNVATWGSAPQAPRSSSVQGTTKSSMGDRRPLGSIGSITGFGSSSVSSKKGKDDATSAASSKCIAVGHGSVRPPPSRCSTATDRAATESIAIESLEIQLDEERRIRKAMESRLENLSSMIERLSAAAPTPTPQGRRTPSAQPRSRKVTFQQK